MIKKVRTGSLSFDKFESPLGTLYLVFLGNTLVRIEFEKTHRVEPAAHVSPERVSYSLKIQLREYFKGKLREFTQEVVLLQGTDFDKKVWLVLKEIPYGETRSYRWLAERTGNPKAVRAVGQALSRNPIPIILPCHRIIESNGSLGGYSGGINIKRRLLDLEYYYTIGMK
jgi:methylated-DNA-[protein]-cysteine S-methyltransferase